MTSNALGKLGDLANAFQAASEFVQWGGQIVSITPHFFKVGGLEQRACIGDVVSFANGGEQGYGSIIRVDHDEVLVAPFRETTNLRLGQDVFIDDRAARKPTHEWLGRCFNAIGEPIDDRPAPISQIASEQGDVRTSSLSRGRINKGLKTGVRAIDIFTPLCYGQRMGIFAGSGVGKSTLLAMLAKTQAFDVAVVCLVGERGREVREFLDDSIGEKAMAKTVAIVATSDESAMMRRQAPELAMEVASFFRSNGKRVLLLVDSVTRYAHALREVGISAGEPPIARGYPASVFTELPKLLEQAGMGDEATGGSVTAIISVLVDGDDHNDPIADAVRGILDGHLVLDRAIADQGRYPPIDTMKSLSRLAQRVWTKEHQKLVMQLKAMIARYEETADLRLLGAWQRGNDPGLDQAVDTVPVIYEALCQSPFDPASFDAFAELAGFLKRSQNPNG